MLTLDSNSDGVVSADDHGDDAEEHGENKNLLLIKKVVYGSDESSSNQVRESSLALVRGPNAYPDGSRPIPLFQYYYDHDEDEATPYKLWGDDNPEDGSLSDSEIGALTPVPANLLGLIRKVRVTVLSESNRFDPAFEAEGGFVSVRMNSEVYIRNSVRVQAVVYGEVFYDVNGDGLKGPGENGLADVDVAIVGLNRAVKTSSNGAYSIPLGSGTYTVEETDPAGYVSTTSNTVSVTLDSGQPQRVDFGDK
jgi:hypothetical protein